MSRHHAKSVSGFSLIELMVAMLLGLIVIGGVISVFIANQQVYRANTALGDVQDGTRMSFEMLARNIREAGLTGCNNSGQVVNLLPEGPSGPDYNAPTDWWANWGNALVGYGIGTVTVNPALTVGNAMGNQVAATDSLMILSASDIGLSVKTQNSDTTFTLNGTSNDLALSKVMIVCDPWLSTIFRISSYTPDATNPVVGYATPANFSTNLSLGYPLPTGVNSYTYAANSPIAPLAAGVWYIGYNPASGTANPSTSLYLASVDTTDGKVTDEEMVRGVTAMNITYNMANSTDFVTAANVTNWSSVVAVQVNLTVQQNNTANAGVTTNAGTYTAAGASAGAAAIKRTYTITATVRNRVN